MIKRLLAFVLLVAWMPLCAAPMYGPAGVRAKADTLFSADSTKRPNDSLAAKPQGARKLKAVRRDYEFRQQIGLAVAMMAFVLVIFTTTQNWNPD